MPKKTSWAVKRHGGNNMKVGSRAEAMREAQAKADKTGKVHYVTQKTDSGWTTVKKVKPRKASGSRGTTSRKPSKRRQMKKKAAKGKSKKDRVLKIGRASVPKGTDPHVHLENRYRSELGHNRFRVAKVRTHSSVHAADRAEGKRQDAYVRKHGRMPRPGQRNRGGGWPRKKNKVHVTYEIHAA